MPIGCISFIRSGGKNDEVNSTLPNSVQEKGNSEKGNSNMFRPNNPVGSVPAPPCWDTC